MKSPYEFRQQGRCGHWVSSLLPHLAGCVDDLAFIHSMVAKSNNHTPATFQMNTGFTMNGFPCMGAWLSYGLGTENENLPTFVVLPDSRGLPAGRSINWTAGFLPAIHQGVSFRTNSPEAIVDLKNLLENHTHQAATMDQPVAGLIQDLKRRGMLEDTLVIWATEFGRGPATQGSKSPGRDHHPDAFTCFLAGAGVKKGCSFGASDEVGYFASENPVTIYDFHATILHLLGLDHERLTFYHNGINRRLTDVHGQVVRGVLA